MYDILLESDLDLPQSSVHTTGIAIVAQRVHLRLAIFRGEWILNRFEGLPYLDWVTQKMSQSRVAEIGEQVKREVTTTPGVNRIINFKAERVRTLLRIGGSVIVDRNQSFNFILSPFATPGDDNASPFFLYQLNRSGPIAPF